MSLEVEKLLARLGVPDFRCQIIAAGDNAFAVGAVRRAPHPVFVPLEGEELLTRGGIPHSHMRLPIAGDDLLPVGAVRHAGDRAVVRLEGNEFLPGRGVPDPGLAGRPGTITGSSDDAF